MSKIKKSYLYHIGFFYRHNSVEYHKQVLIDSTSIIAATKELMKIYGKTYDIIRITSISEAIPYEYTR